MSRQPAKHPDPIVRDLQKIRRLRWSQPNSFNQLETLLRHPLVGHLAKDSGDVARRVKALRQILDRTCKRIERHERKHPPPLDRSVSFAGTVMLRLAPEVEDATVNDLRTRVAEHWGGKGADGKVTTDGFRQHLEIPEFYEPYAAEFRRFAREQAKRHGFALGASGMGSDGAKAPHVSEVKASLNLVARRICDVETETYEQRLIAIHDGALIVRNADEMLKMLLLLTESAEHELQAVDRIDICEWFDSTKLASYLRLQLKLVSDSNIKVERIRLVDPHEFEDERGRDQLTEFIRMHDQSSARLLLCPVDEAKELGTSFYPKMGLLTMDACSGPLAVTLSLIHI